MATRCQIGFYKPDNKDLMKPDALLYQHWDGSPGELDRPGSGMLPDLVPFLRLFAHRRGLGDVEYAAAWTMHHLIELSVQDMKEGPLPRFADGRHCLSYGISQDFHADIEYYYAVRGQTLTVYTVEFSPRRLRERDFRACETISLAPSPELPPLTPEQATGFMGNPPPDPAAPAAAVTNYPARSH